MVHVVEAGYRPGSVPVTRGVRFRLGRVVRASVFAGVAACVCCWPLAGVMAHQWYPKTCCNDQDCFAADRVERHDDGTLEIHAGPVRVIVPPGFEARTSRDNRIHVCVWRDGMGRYHARCLFLPGVG